MANQSVMDEIRERAGITNVRAHLHEAPEDSEAMKVAEHLHKELEWIRNSVRNAQTNLEQGHLATALYDVSAILDSLGSVMDTAGAKDVKSALQTAKKSLTAQAKNYMAGRG